MYYKKEEIYTFSVPRELEALVAFKERLKEMGVPFLETGGAMTQSIKTVEHGKFDIDEEGVFQSIG